MNVLLPRFLRSIYRHDPISGILITMGLVDIALGGVSGHGGLSLLGIVIFGGALSAKWLQSQRRHDLLEQESVQHFLPAQSSQQEMPMLSMTKKRPPN